MLEENSLINIMMATYNGENYIREQIESIIYQTYTEWKLYISDDGSTDRTKAIIQEYIECYPDKIMLLKSRKSTHCAKGNFSFLFETVPNADYYAFCDQDDVWLPEKLNTLLETIEGSEDEPMLVYHDLKVVNQDKELIAESFYEYSNLFLDERRPINQVLLYNCIPGCAMMYNHKLREKIQKIPIDCIMHDWWVLLVTLCYGDKIIHSEKKLGLYRQHGNNELGAVEKKSIAAMILKCFDFKNIVYYRNNNKRMRLERITQTKQLIKEYENRIKRENLQVVKDFLQLMESRNRMFNLIRGVKKRFVFYDFIYTIKFYLL